MFPSRRPLPPVLVAAVSSSPAQSVSEEAAGVWRGHCARCEAGSDPGEDDAAWHWVDHHLCGIETIRPDLAGLS